MFDLPPVEWFPAEDKPGLETKTVIFDMDGVLIDSQPHHYQVDILALREAGVEADLTLVERYAGMTNPDRWAKYKKDLGLAQNVHALSENHLKILSDYFLREDIQAIDGVKAILQVLRDAGCKTAVASSSARAFVEMILRKAGIYHFFAVIIGGEDADRGKPAPDIFLRAAEQLEVLPGDCVVVEDSTNGVLAAKEAGMFCIGYCNENSGRQELSNADAVIRSFGEFWDAFRMAQ